MRRLVLKFSPVFFCTVFKRFILFTSSFFGRFLFVSVTKLSKPGICSFGQNTVSHCKALETCYKTHNLQKECFPSPMVSVTVRIKRCLKDKDSLQTTVYSHDYCMNIYINRNFHRDLSLYFISHSVK